MDMVAAILVVIGALNWGLVGLFGFDLVAALFGHMSWLSRAVYVLVGLSGLYQANGLKRIQHLWGVVARSTEA